MTNRDRIDRLYAEQCLPRAEWTEMLSAWSAEDAVYAGALAQEITVARFGKQIFFRGIIEFTNICRNDCLYCGIRRSNVCVTRYRLTQPEILECCAEGYRFGYRTFVLQGGEDGYFNDGRLTALVSAIHERYPDCAITLSVGERSRVSYQRLFDAGASRYLLRHETADTAHYAQLHPPELSLENRMRCLRDLKEIGYQTGAGMMVGAPHQTPEHLAADMVFLGEFRPQMVGMGPFIPHHQTPFRDQPAGSAELTLFLLSLTRIMLPDVLLPATTALGTLRNDGRQRGVLAGCNVVMPNLSPAPVRKKYLLYDNKAGTEDTPERSLRTLERQMREIGYEIVAGRGDYIGRG